MKLKNNLKNLRFNIFIYFLIFTVALIFIVWILQAVFFESNYKNVRYQTMRTYSDIIKQGIDFNGQVNESAVLTLKENGIDAIILTTPNPNSIGVLYPRPQYVTPQSQLYEIYSNILNNYMKEGVTSFSGEQSFTQNKTAMYNISRVEYKNDNAYLLLISDMQSLDEIAKVMRFQLIMTTLIVIVLSLFFSWLIAGRLSSPINEMSKVAKKWASGDENATFNEIGYTEITELAKTLNYAKTEKEKSQVLQRDLLANVSHDLKTPLTMIKAYAETIKDISGENKEKRTKHTEIIIDEADRLTSLVNDILNLSKLQAKVLPLEKTNFNLSKTVEDVLLKFEPILKNGGYVLVNKIQPNVMVNANEQKIEEVIHNLIGNAINYTGEDKIVKVYLSVKDGKASLEIIDSGKGIQSNKIDTIWEKYYRSSETHQRPIKGTGLGLSIVKAILLSHEIDFGVISKEGLGSNFYAVFDVVNNNKLDKELKV